MYDKRLILILLIILVLTLGLRIADNRAQIARDLKKENILSNSIDISLSLDIELVKQLTFSKADINNPAYIDICKHFKKYSSISDFEGIFSFTMVDGKLVFGPESYDLESELGSHPGDIYKNYPKEYIELFSGAKPFIKDLYTDEYGEFVTALTPLHDPETGKTLIVIGVDILGKDWNKITVDAYKDTLIITSLILFAIISISIASLIKKRQVNQSNKLKSLETYSVLLAGIILTICTTIVVYEYEIFHVKEKFNKYAYNDVELTRDSLDDLKKDVKLIKNYFDGSDFVFRNEFSTYASSAINSPAVKSLKWVPIVSNDKKDVFIEYTRQDDAPNFNIWYYATGKKAAPQEKDFYYPICYEAKPDNKKDLEGFDISTIPEVKLAIEKAINTSYPNIIDSSLISDSLDKSFSIICPVFSKKQDQDSKSAYGIIIIDFSPDELIENETFFMRSRNNYTSSGIIELVGDEAEFIYTRKCSEHKGVINAKWTKDQESSNYKLTPLFLFDRTFVALSHPTEEFYTNSPTHLSWASFIVGLIITAMISIFVGILSSKKSALEYLVAMRTKELSEQEKDLSTTLSSIGDAVITTDINSKITRMNPVANKLTGWSSADAKGQDVSKVFNIINTSTRKPAVDVVRKVLGLGITSNLSNHTSLISKDGKEYQIADSAAPIKDESGQIKGAVIVFHDVSEQYEIRQKAEESRRRFLSIFNHSINAVALHRMIFDADGNPTDYIFLEANPAFEKHTGIKIADAIGKRVTELHPGPQTKELIEKYGEVIKTGKPAIFDLYFKESDRYYSVKAYKTGKDLFATIFQNITEKKLAEDALIESQEKYKYLIDNIQGISYHCNFDKTWKMNFISEEISRLTGYPVSDFIDNSVRTFESIIHPQDRQMVWEIIEDAVSHGNKFKLEYRLICSNGQIVWVSERGQAIVENGIPVSLDGVIFDITDRKKAVAKLEQIEWMLSKEVISSTEEKSSRSNSKEICKKFSGIEANSIILNAIGKEMLSNITTDYMDLMGTSSAIYERDGNYTLGIFSSGWCKTLDDASRKLCNADSNELSECSKWHCHQSGKNCAQKAVESGKPVDSECNGGLRIHSVPIVASNKTVGAINLAYGDPPKEIEKIREIAERYEVDPDKLLAESNCYQTRPKYIIQMAKNRLVNTARLIGLLLERKQANDEIERANKRLLESAERMQALAKEAQAATKAKSHFLANMSHEIRTPMNGVIGMLELLIDTPLTEDQLNYANIARSSGIALVELINDILDFSKIEAGKTELEINNFKLSAITEDIINILSPEASKKGIEIICNIEDDIPNELQGDSKKLRQILMNLSGNAVKFTNKGKVEIKISKIKKSDSFVELKFEINDTGIGIEEDKIHLLFNAFQQIDNSNTRQFGGTGLGLVISKKLVEILGGDIGVESQIGKGSKFWFTSKFEKIVNQDNQSRKDAPEDNQPMNITFSECHILVAEDNPINQKVAVGILEKLGIKADVAENGHEAIKALENKTYDLVLMDVQMSVMDGIKATEIIRSGDCKIDNPQLPIIAMTANAMDKDRKECLDAGMDDYISKPFTPNSLSMVLERWMKK
ncbi:MAG: PAS domain S-box protein [Sedimentisphaeraceae bacterium JB056]